MLMLLVIAITGLGFAYLATQNNMWVTVNLTQYTQFHMPLWTVVLGALLIGFFISWVLSLIDSISNSVALHQRENKIRATSREVGTLEDRVHDLEVENAKLKGENVEHVREDVHGHYEDSATVRPSFFDRLRHGLAF
ncbi:MAG TPA: lipopolysaccharide assembly protein LapA domain-containing protein [Candidatus Saccharimonadales bacterium]|nr:lipopolysaccharide assembly protein LapA domain-containing protein [Candidatus Saccharimonadales bacterium]